MTTTDTRRPSDDEIASALLRLRAADPVRDHDRIDDTVDADTMLASVRGDRGRHRPGRARRLVPVVVAAALVIIVAAAVAFLPRMSGGSATGSSKPAPVALPAKPATSARAAPSAFANTSPVSRRPALNPIARGARLPAIDAVTISETSGDAPTRALGYLPSDAAGRVVKILNTAEAASSTTGPLPLTAPLCTAGPGRVTSYTLTMSSLQPSAALKGVLAPTTVGIATLNDSCTGFFLTVGKTWYGTSSDRSLLTALNQAVLRPVADLPRPTSIDVTSVSLNLLTGNRRGSRHLGTLTDASAEQVWRELTSLGSVESGPVYCPLPVHPPVDELVLKRYGRVYARAVTQGGCDSGHNIVNLTVIGEGSYRLTYATPVLRTLVASLRHSR